MVPFALRWVFCEVPTRALHVVGEPEGGLSFTGREGDFERFVDGLLIAAFAQSTYEAGVSIRPGVQRGFASKPQVNEFRFYFQPAKRAAERRSARPLAPAPRAPNSCDNQPGVTLAKPRSPQALC